MFDSFAAPWTVAVRLLCPWNSLGKNIGVGFFPTLEKEMATHSSILDWKILWTEEPGRLHTVHVVQIIGHDLVTQ